MFGFNAIYRCHSGHLQDHKSMLCVTHHYISLCLYKNSNANDNDNHSQQALKNKAAIKAAYIVLVLAIG